jgi:hypothetical protein
MKRWIQGAVIVLLVAVMFPVGVWAQVTAEHHADRHEAHRHALMEKVYGHYFLIRSSLARDSTTDVSANARAIAAETDAYLKMHGEAGDVNMLLSNIRTAAKSLAEKEEITAARPAFGDVSEKLIEYQKTYVTNNSEKAHVFFCDMAKKGWLQETTDVGNPYYGSAMLKCGKEIK